MGEEPDPRLCYLNLKSKLNKMTFESTSGSLNGDSDEAPPDVGESMTDQHEECLQIAFSQVSLAKAYEPYPPVDVGSSGITR